MLTLFFALSLLVATGLHAQAPPSAETHFQRVMANPNLQVEGQITGEQFCWHAASGADDFVDAYLAWNDAAWLDRGAAYFDWLVSLMATAPDGYRGWIGPYIYDEQYWCDVHVGDAILINPMLRFAEVVLANDELKEIHGQRAQRYVQLAQRELIEKWDQRGTWHDDGPQGSYRAWDHYLAPNDLSTWHHSTDPKAGLSLPFNKQMDMGIAALRLYRITGQERYRQRAERVFRLFKSRLRLFDGGYVWNYWEPLGPWDIDRKERRIRHWVNVHPTRNYQAREVAFVAEAYHTGLVFTRTDIERIIHTNLENMWNGDGDQPRWRNAGLGGEWAPQKKKRAGTLWSALVDFDERARQLQAQRLRVGSIDHAYFHNVVATGPPSFARRYAATGPQEKSAALESTPNLVMAAALPRVSNGDTAALLLCKTARDDALQITLHATDATSIDTLYDGRIKGGDDGLEGIFWISWDAAGVSPGTYSVRWRLGDEVRDCAIERR
ncbi:MAG: hypothetical protein ACI906_002648 [Candidatus Latescibacterota bacterium]|jgi:hypothetical protein